MPARKAKEPPAEKAKEEPKKKPLPVSRWDFELTKFELEQMAERAAEWKEDSTRMVEWFEEKQAICFQVYFKMITNPVTSRSGPEKLLKSIDDFLSYGTAMMGAHFAKQRSSREDVEGKVRAGPDTVGTWKPPKPGEKEALRAERESSRVDGEPESFT